MQLVMKFAKETKFSKSASKKVVDTVFGLMSAAIKKEKIFIPGFGTFKTMTRKARNGRNPRTGEKIKIKAKKVVKFVPAAAIKKLFVK